MVQEKRNNVRDNLNWLKNNNLTKTSHPIEYLNAAMIIDEVGHNGKKLSMFEEWTQLTNMKAIFMGTRDVLHPDLKPFNMREIRQNVGLHHLN